MICISYVCQSGWLMPTDFNRSRRGMNGGWMEGFGRFHYNLITELWSDGITKGAKLSTGSSTTTPWSFISLKLNINIQTPVRTLYHLFRFLPSFHTFLSPYFLFCYCIPFPLIYREKKRYTPKSPLIPFCPSLIYTKVPFSFTLIIILNHGW